MLKRFIHLLGALGILLSLFVFQPPAVAHASTTWTVDSTADAAADGVCNVSPGDCTLRDALGLAASGDTINITATPTITVDSGLGQYYLSDNLTMTGPGPGLLTITGADLVRDFYVPTGFSVAISGMTITHGINQGESNGGAIINFGNLTLDNVVVSDSNAVGYAGGIYDAPWASLTVTDSTISGNSASTGAGIFSHSNALLSLTNVQITGNDADLWGGGVNIDDYSSSYSNTFDKVYFYNNKAGEGGGGLYLNSHANVTITNSAFVANSGVKYGGALSTYANNLGDASTLSLRNVTISGNYLTQEPGSRQGAGMYIQGNAILNNVTVMDNDAGTGGGFTNTSNGGAFYDFSPVGSTLDIKNSIFAHNFADSGPICAGASFASTAMQYTLLREEPCYATNGVNGVVVGSDPILNPLIYAGYASVYPLNSGSPALDTGDNSTCEASDQRNTPRPQGLGCDMGAYELIPTLASYRSTGANDGWVLETTETSKQGGTFDSAATYLRVGDEAGDKQYRSILHFDTHLLPDTATIVGVQVKIKKLGFVGASPFSSLLSLLVDIKKPSYGTSLVQSTDFQATGGTTAAAAFGSIPVSNWYTAKFTVGLANVNKTGTTQVRIRFSKDDNDNNLANYLKFYSGNAATSVRPVLYVYYYP